MLEWQTTSVNKLTLTAYNGVYPVAVLEQDDDGDYSITMDGIVSQMLDAQALEDAKREACDVLSTALKSEIEFYRELIAGLEDAQ